ncbi:hydroxymethylglutaryl-CoA lyase [Polynucleobacter sp. MWH-Braz-FAM2G]|uniref:hydroxymethylglutaryl-CoA lyase n=1 Tax=Polynucleobacter sp. MWH-Braz-FAM2G TaxID=1855883 RepID=UPI001BFE7F23|nr:hydroxymethylglutaryl-CoA lyase [Polynucleobacter sp. MWH-Braz-FAM2G]QWD91706.1 hydroxymethylglutaryl-CoA lyase [Polynucleobacter sp. MWH-Braz-FAM2G]
MKSKVNLPKKVKIVEVGPRDGLQNEKLFVDNDIKIALIDRLTSAGFINIEVAAFVSPKWVPQMAGSDIVMNGISRKPGTLYSVLVPNLQGFEKAIEARTDEIVIFGAASETFSQKNINCSIEESIARFIPVVQAAKSAGIRVRGSVSCALGCPYEGEIDPKKVVEVVQRMANLGCDEIDIADTIGVGTPNKVKTVFEQTGKVFSIERLSGHFHDTYGQSLANIYAALEMGVSIFHSAVAGLGGCPYAKGATGNVATEDVLYLMAGLGIETGIDFEKVALSGEFISNALNRPNGSKAGKAYLSKINNAQ